MLCLGGGSCLYYISNIWQEDLEFQASLGYRASSGPAWATTEASPLKQKKQQKQKQNPEGSGDHPHGLHFSAPLLISGGGEILTCLVLYTWHRAQHTVILTVAYQGLAVVTHASDPKS